MCYNGNKSVKTAILFECLVALFFVASSLFFLCVWTLPENEGNKSGLYNNSYGNLLASEGVIAKETSTSYATGGFNKLISPPLSFARSGSHDRTSTTLLYRGSYGYYWAKTATNAIKSYNFNFAINDFTSRSTFYEMTNGLSLRCVAW